MQNHGSFDYAKASYFPAWKNSMIKLEATKNPSLTDKRTTADFVDHFFTKYGDCHDYLPLWMGVGRLRFYFLFLPVFAQEDSFPGICGLGVKSEILRSWLIALNTLRNTCGHHGRVWNKVWGTRPDLPRYADQAEWYMTYLDKAGKWVRPPANNPKPGDSIAFHSGSTAALLYICKYLLSYIAPQSQWKTRVEKLFAEFVPLGIDLEHMGFSMHWEEHPLWK